MVERKALCAVSGKVTATESEGRWDLTPRPGANVEILITERGRCWKKISGVIDYNPNCVQDGDVLFEFRVFYRELDHEPT